MSGVDLGLELLPELACDRVMPVWVARARGIPSWLGVVRWTWVPPFVGGGRSVRVWWVGYSEGEASLPGHLLRHGLALAVARYYLGAGPGVWDALVVREAPGDSSRRTIRGRAWARENRDRLKKVPRPDGEWWLRGRTPWAVEVDAGGMDLAVYRRRLPAWMRVYAGLVVVVLSPSRAERWGGILAPLLRDYPGWAGRIRVYALEGWWDEGASWRLVWSAP